MTTQNELVELVTMRSNINVREIKKSQALVTIRSNINVREIKKSQTVKIGLNQQPRIFNTPNNLLVVTSVLVGFFVNNYYY